VLATLDSALVSTADGTGAAWYQRDRKMFSSLAWRSVRMHLRLLRRWPQVSAAYRAAAADFTSPQRWRETFDASTSDRNLAR
jgi:galactofuranosylgalactofuranosylrhamnosyl-N-acetylglucosaminyl-diphospho-decaprenol beta-1,5/1,6-galactofuranosyltransferase